MTSEAASTRARSVQAPSAREHADDEVCINTIRTLAIDAVQKANSGHPGTPMALAPAAYVLWQEFLRYDPANPLWPNRDRFVLSAGHASMLERKLPSHTPVRRRKSRSVPRMNRPKELQQHGQSISLDFLSRSFIADGGLRKLVEEDGVQGVTLNPSIFEKAIGHSADYDLEPGAR